MKNLINMALIHIPYWKYIDKMAKFEFMGKYYNFYISAKNFYHPELGFEFFVLYRIIEHNVNNVEYLYRDNIRYSWRENKHLCYNMPLFDALDLIERDNEGYYYVNI